MKYRIGAMPSAEEQSPVCLFAVDADDVEGPAVFGVDLSRGQALQLAGKLLRHAIFASGRAAEENNPH